MMSLTTCMLNVAGNTTRIFTTLVLTRDMYILSACTTQFVLNSILLWQCVVTKRRQRKQSSSIQAGSAVGKAAGGEQSVSSGMGGSTEGGAGGAGMGAVGANDGPAVGGGKGEGETSEWDSRGGGMNKGGGPEPQPA